jgi:DNA-binding transcriptional MerR regulator
VLTISQLAAYAGVTVRAVRHYHATGLLPEPERDSSGYRRYDARAVVELIRIRTLAEAGVPLARVRELLQADDKDFATAIAEIDTRLRAEIRELQRHRARIARLAAGDSLALPAEAVEYLGRMRELGISERMVEGERDSWILVAAQLPERMPFYMAMKREQIEDPGVVDLYRSLDQAIDWQPSDPRLPALADRLTASIEAATGSTPEDVDEFEMPADLVELLDAFFLDNVPIARRLLDLLEERGWTGWTNLERIDRANPVGSHSRR